MRVEKMARSALFAALLSICAWLAVPVGDGFITLQTLGVFLCLGLLGGKWGTISICLYLLLGAVGLPVFSGFRGGLGAILDATGGYILGFLFTGGMYWLLTALLGSGRWVKLTAWVLGLSLCYLFGSVWYWYFYLGQGGTFLLVLLKCVVPYLLPDGIKLVMAFFLTEKLERFV